jgi:lysophospholipase L1-like esterase
VDIKIQAFGACMVGGFPHRPEDSFFHHAIERLRPETSHQLIPSLFTMGGFPITRVPKHLAPRCLATQPHIVVLQFGSSDLIVPLRRKRQHHSSGSSSSSASSSSQRKVSTQPPGLFHLAKWQLHGLLGEVLRRQPITGQEIYLATQIELVTTLLKHQVTPVVMSPFVFGGRRSDRLARECTQRLQTTLAAVPGAIFVNAYAALDQHPRRQMLLSDGSHLSLAGQKVLAEALFASLKPLITNEAWLANINSPSSLS